MWGDGQDEDASSWLFETFTNDLVDYDVIGPLVVAYSSSSPERRDVEGMKYIWSIETIVGKGL